MRKRIKGSFSITSQAQVHPLHISFFFGAWHSKETELGFTRFNNGVFYCSCKKSTTPLVPSTLGFLIIHYNLSII